MSKRPFSRSLAVSLAVSLVLASAACTRADAQEISPIRTWVGAWAASQQIPEPENSLAPDDLTDTTIRQIVHFSIGGDQLRVPLSNAFGASALRLTSVHIARPLHPDSSRIDPQSDRTLTFSGAASVLIPPGAQFLSDPIDYTLPPLSDLTITLHIESPPSPQTGHPGSRATTYIAHGDLVSQPELTGAKTIDHWYIVAGVDIATPPSAFSIVTLGDSITDGHAATINGNDRWPDVLARRLQATPSTRNIAVLNQGIGGNHLLTDGLGPNVLARFDRDVLAQPGVRYVIVLEGINDLGSLARMTGTTPQQHDTMVKRMVGAYEQVIARSHAQGIKVIGATILPDAGSDYYHPGPANEADRQAVNQWIRTPGHFDAVVDLDKVMADPQTPDRLRPAYDSGDHLHPSPAGYKAMGEAFPLSLFAR
jgi:lysophospholipase L1-like esterase